MLRTGTLPDGSWRLLSSVLAGEKSVVEGSGVDCAKKMTMSWPGLRVSQALARLCFVTKSINTETIFLDFVIVYKIFIHIDFRVRFGVLGNFLPLSLQSAS